MFLPKLINIAWVLALLEGAFIVLAIAGESMKRQRGLGVAFQWAPFLFPVICVAAFMIASRVDRKNAERLRAVGVVAPAVVLEVRDSGIEVGVDPVLTVRVRVTPEGAEPFEGEVPYVPSRLEMGRVREGTTVRVRYDPQDRGRIAVEAITSVSFP